MRQNSEEITERVNFDLTGELAEWMFDLKRRGLFATNPEIVRLSLTYLRHHYRQRLGVTVERETKESEGH
jgi:Arc/MetJ-type ribon-helix-helix transcriptional regulator